MRHGILARLIRKKCYFLSIFLYKFVSSESIDETVWNHTIVVLVEWVPFSIFDGTDFFRPFQSGYS